jgi:hypothetical protein
VQKPECVVELGNKVTPKHDAATVGSDGVVAFNTESATGGVCLLEQDATLTTLQPRKDLAGRTFRAGVFLVDSEGPHVSQAPAVPPSTCASSDLDTDDEAHIAVDLTQGGSVTRTPLRNVILPNQGLIAHLCRTPDQTIDSVVWGGTRGLSTTSANNQGTQKDREAAQLVPTNVVVQEFRFAPRQPGSADLTITYEDGTPPKPVILPAIELEVDALYWGSVRLGLGTLFDAGQNWQSYSIQTFAGSAQPEIRQAHSGVGFEIVSGFAPYLFDVLTCPGHGRSYTGGCNRWVAPYIGFGVVGTAPEGVQALSSFHAGLEFEFSKSFSIAVTVAIRRMQALTNGYVVGSPVTAGMSVQDVTRDAWSPGVGVIVNATPAFLQFAMPSGSGGGSGK